MSKAESAESPGFSRKFESRGARCLLACAACICASAATAQLGMDSGGTPARAWQITPRVSVTETFSDNVGLATGGGRSDQITQISPGLRVQANAAHLKGFLDYQLNNLTYAKGSAANSSQNALTAFGSLEAFERRGFVDFDASISRRLISAFGAQSPTTGSLNANSTETTTYRVSPYVKGVLGTLGQYTLRYSHSESRASSTLTSDSAVDQFIATLTGSQPLFGMTWTLDANRQSSRFGSGTRSDLDTVRAKFQYPLHYQIKLTATLGTESNNYASAQTQSKLTFGYGFDWTPSERTQLSVLRERRFFGDGHTITFSHRMPLTAIRFTDSRNVAVQPNNQSASSQGTYYDLLFSQLATSVPDPVQRAQQVSALLQQSGISPNASITSGFLSSRATISRRQDLSLVINGLRNTVTYTLFQSVTDSFGAFAATADDFSSNTSVRQKGMSSNFSHRLSPLTSLNALSSWSRSEGNATGATTTLRAFNVNIATRFGPRISGSFGLRSSRSDGTSQFRENAVLGTLTAQF